MSAIPPSDPVAVLALVVAKATFSELAKKLATNFVKAAGKPLKSVYEAITTNFEPHLKTTYLRCTRVKTILNREEPVDLLGLYVGTNFVCSKNLYTDEEVIEQIHNRKHAAISGLGGSGKTFFMKYFWLTVFADTRGKIPVFVELRKLNDFETENLITYIYRSIINTNSNVSADAYP